MYSFNGQIALGRPEITVVQQGELGELLKCVLKTWKGKKETPR